MKFNSSYVNTYETYVHEKAAALSWSETDLIELAIYGLFELDVRRTVIIEQFHFSFRCFCYRLRRRLTDQLRIWGISWPTVASKVY